MKSIEVALIMQKVGYSVDDSTLEKIKPYMDALEQEFIRLYDIEERYQRMFGRGEDKNGN